MLSKQDMQIVIIRTINKAKLIVVSTGVIILDIHELNNSNETNKISTDTSKPPMYSLFLCPYGCSLSAGLAFILNEKTLIIELRESLILLMASPIIEILEVIIPIISFKTTSKTLAKTPTPPHTIPNFSLLLSVTVLLIHIL